LALESELEQLSVPDDLDPQQVAVHFEDCSSSRNGAQFTPEPQITVLWQPAVRDAFELAAMQTDLRSKRPKIGSPGGLTGLFQRGELVHCQSRSRRGVLRRGIRRRARLADNISKMVFKIH